jgi:hypothetical protein
MRPRRTLPALVCALALGLPAGAVAQSAGDDQYTDPFSGQQPPSAPQGSQGDSRGDSESAPQTAQATPSPSETDPGQAQPAQDEALPRTGFEAVLPLAYGVVLLLSGIALRLGARSRPR